jgi:hypothetical protein
MAEPTVKTKRSRYRLVVGAAAVTGRSALAGDAKNLPLGVSDRACNLGNGARAHGRPSKYVKNITRYTASWLPAAPESTVSFTLLHSRDSVIMPNGLGAGAGSSPEFPRSCGKVNAVGHEIINTKQERG